MTTTPAHQIDYSKFIFYHPSTKGDNGRKVFIDKNLIVRFMELIDSQDKQSLSIAREIITLKSLAAGITADSSTSCAHEHKQNFKNVVVTYTVLQSGGRGAGVYITNLQYLYSLDKGRPGLYKVESDRAAALKWRATVDDSTDMPSSIGVLGALPPSDLGIADPDKTASVFAEGVLAQKEKNLSKGFALFYTPTYAIDNVGAWVTSEQKRSAGLVSCPTAFARILATTENKTKSNFGEEQRYRWYIVGQGVKVFQQALQEYKRICKHPLKRSHDFYFVDPQVPLGLLEQDLRAQGVDFYRDRNVISTSLTVAGQVNQLFDETSTFRNMHRPWEREVALNSSLREVDGVLNPYRPPAIPLCFSEIVNKLTAALQGRW